MSSGLIEIIKRSALDAVEANKPCDLRYGTVTSVSPLKVRVTNQFTLPASLLIVPEHLTNHSVQVTINWNTEAKGGGVGESSFASHSHEISGKKTMTIHNALKVGDKVVLIRQAGGQQFLILDRL